MRSAVIALAWEFWAANRRGWQILLAAIIGCGLLFRVFTATFRDSQGLQFFCLLPMVMSVILGGAFCNFTDHERRDGIAGFPRHLFVLPLKTAFLVTCTMACGLVSVLSIYIAWATIVLPPINIDLWVRWPATLIATFVVFYQAIIWCLCGFRLTRIATLSLVATTLVGVGFMPMLLPETNVWSSQVVLTAALAALSAAAYLATVVTVGVQRRGGGRGWTLVLPLVDRLAGTLSNHRRALKSAGAALFWIEWRRSGFVLPVSVLLTAILILFLVIRFTAGDAKGTIWAETWLGLMPLLLALPIGMGFGKPDFWSLELSLPTFVAARPVTVDQLLAAKMKAAAISTVLAWTVLLLIAPLCIYLYLDTEHWHEMWQMSGILYSNFSRWALSILALVIAMLLTWSLLIANVWLGYSGRSAFYYSFVAVGMAGLLTTLYFLVWWAEFPHSCADFFVKVLPWLPWLLAAAISAKVWAAAACAYRLQSCQLVTGRNIAIVVCIWLIAATCLMYGGWLLSPRIEWLRDTLLLAALCAIPLARLAATPLTMAWNRHR